MTARCSLRSNMISESQKLHLLNLIEEKKAIIENKINTVTVNKQKKKAWKLIAEKFNKEYQEEKKSDQQLRSIYKRIKINAKKKIQ